MKTYWWPACQSEAGSPDCCWQHTHRSCTPYQVPVQSKWNGSWLGAPSDPWLVHRSSSGNGSCSQWWKQSEASSGRWRRWSGCQRSPGRLESPELKADNRTFCPHEAVWKRMNDFWPLNRIDTQHTMTLYFSELAKNIVKCINSLK